MTQDLIDRLRENGIAVFNDDGSLKFRGSDQKTVDMFLPELKQRKKEILTYLAYVERQMQADIALIHGQAIAHITGYISKRYGKPYYQAQDNAQTMFQVMREAHIRQALIDGRHDAAERLISECMAKFNMPDYLAQARQKRDEDR